MNDLRKVFSFDFFLLKKERLWQGILAILLLACLVFALSAFYSPGSSIEIPNRADTLASYQLQVAHLQELLASGQLSPSEVVEVNHKIDLFNFYLSSGSIAQDYVNPATIVELGSPYTGVAFAFKSLEVAFPFMALLVPFSFYHFAFAHGALGAKNFLMAPLDKQKAFQANFLFSLGLVLLTLLAFLVAALLGVFLGGNPSILYEIGGKYVSIHASFLLLPLFLSLLTYILLLYGMCFLAYLLFHQDYITIFLPLLVSLVFLALFAIVSLSSPTLGSIEKNPAAAYFPFLSLYNLAFYSLSYPYWVSWGIHSLVGFLLLFLCFRHYKKEGFSA